MSEVIANLKLVECDDDGQPALGEKSEMCEVRIVHESPSAIRVIMDPSDGDHDLLIECHADKWMIVFHPSGGDPMCIIDVLLSTLEHPQQTVRVSDDSGKVLKEEEW